MDKTLKSMTEKTDAATLDPSKKQVPEEDGLFKVLPVWNLAVTVGDNDIHNVVSIHRIRLANTAEEAMQATLTESHGDVPLEAGNAGDEYVVEHIVRDKEDHDGTRYVVRWYGYNPADATWKPTHHVSQYFIRQYWQCQRRVN